MARTRIGDGQEERAVHVDQAEVLARLARATGPF
jgi:hypothetical protein